MTQIKPLSRLDWILARVGLYGWFHQQARLLSRRPVVRFVVLGKTQKLALLCEVKTTKDAPIAAAIRVTRTYYCRRGRPIPARHTVIEAPCLVAVPGTINAGTINPSTTAQYDPEQIVPVWLDCPPGAVIARVRFERLRGQPTIGFRLHNRLRRLGNRDDPYTPHAPLDTPSLSRSTDLLYLWHGLHRAVESGDESVAATAVERIRYLYDTEAARQIQTSLFRYGAKEAARCYRVCCKGLFAASTGFP